MTIFVDELRDLYRDKLERTGSFDAAFTKAVWVAYQKGIEEEASRHALRVDEAITAQLDSIRELCKTDNAPPHDWSHYTVQVEPTARLLVEALNRREWEDAEQHAARLGELAVDLGLIARSKN